MKKVVTEKPEIKLVGISLRTNNEQEKDKLKGKIFPCIQKYFYERLFDKIPFRKNPGTTFCAYTDYESDYRGDYTYLIGEEVSSFQSPLPDGFSSINISKQHYTKFTTEKDAIPNVIINAWNEIWKMSPNEMGGIRTYKTDFEVYDERAKDPRM